MSDPAAVKKSLSAQFSVDVPPPLEQTDPEALSAWVKAGNVTVVDVRLPEEFASGHISGALNLPHNEVNIDDLVAIIRKKREASEDHKLVFTSLQSPDVDEAVAQQFILAWDGGAASDASFVSLLLGGTFFWLKMFRNDTTLTEAYDQSLWEDVLSKHSEL